MAVRPINPFQATAIAQTVAPSGDVVSSIGVTSSTLTVSGSPITSSGDINIELPAQPVYTTTHFGAGAPVALHAEGDLYFDTTAPPYVGYVQHSSAWQAFT